MVGARGHRRHHIDPGSIVGSRYVGTSDRAAGPPGGKLRSRRARPEGQRGRVCQRAGDRACLHSAGLFAGGGHRRGRGAGGGTRAGSLVDEFYPHVLHRRGLLLHEPGRSGLWYFVLLGDTRNGAVGRLDGGLGGGCHKHPRDRLAGGRRRPLYLSDIRARRAGRRKFAVIILAVAYIAVLTWIAVIGIEPSARLQDVLIVAQVLALLLFASVALISVFNGTAPEGSVRPELSWFSPFAISSPDALIGSLLIGVFIYWGWESAVNSTEESTHSATAPGLAAI